MSPRPAARPTPWATIAAAILAGVVLGILGQMWLPIEERLLDGGLVLSGQVSYPAQAVMGLYYKGVWTLLYQLGALVLDAGVGYRAANFVFLLMPPAILTAAFALFIHGLTGRPLFSLAAAILCFMNGYFVSLFASSDYPLLGMAWNTPSTHSHGRFGAVLAAFSFAALVGGREALAAFTAAVLVAIHPVIGVYTVTMLAFGLGVARLAWHRPIVRPVVVGFAAGAGVALTSLAAFLLLRPAMPEVDEAANRVYIEVYSAFWDDHRNRTATRSDLLRVAVLFAVLAVPLLTFLLLRRGRRGAADAGAVALLGAVVVSTALYVLQHWGRALLPDIVLRAIPGRLINMQACFALAVIVGMTVFVADEAARRLRRRQQPKTLGSIFLRHPDAVAVAVAAVLAVRFVPGFVYGVVLAQREPEMVAAQQNLAEIDSPFWSKVRDIGLERLVLTAPELSLKALRYGRLPMALDTTAIDFVPYLPRTATALGTLVERGYGVSFFHPPSALKFLSVLPPGTGRDYWACLSPGQWQGIAQEFGIAALLVPADWTVRLPPMLSDSDYALYAMPAPANVPSGAAEPPCPVRRD
jgi:hypothetical protein